MPKFNPGEEVVAIATFPTKPAGLECTAELWLASGMNKVATSGEIPFTATGGDKSITLPITLPGVEGTYPVYLYVYSNGQRIAAFRGDEDVVIAPLGLTFGTPWGSVAGCSDSSFRGATVYVAVNNPATQTITKRVYCRWSAVYPGTPSSTGYKVFRIDIPRGDVQITYLDVTLLPGQTKTLTAPRESCASDGCGCTSPLFSTQASFYFWWEDEDGNESPAIHLS